MHHKADILLKWEIDTIEYYFQNGLKYYTELLQSEFSENPKQIIGEKDYAIGSFKYFRRSVIYELNALIEQWLLTASSEDGDFFDNTNLKRTRANSVKIIQDKYAIELEKISGFHETETIRRTVNSLKHRGGFDFTDYSRGIPEFKSIKDDIDYLEGLKDSAFKFIKELIDVIIIMEHENTKPNTRYKKLPGQ